MKEIHDQIPVCYCFGITRETLEEEIRQTGGTIFTCLACFTPLAVTLLGVIELAG